MKITYLGLAVGFHTFPIYFFSRVRAACIGKQTRAAADSYGMQTYMSEKATIDSLIELVETLKRREEKWN